MAAFLIDLLNKSIARQGLKGMVVVGLSADYKIARVLYTAGERIIGIAAVQAEIIFPVSAPVCQKMLYAGVRRSAN
jgi:hypothetical protein